MSEPTLFTQAEIASLVILAAAADPSVLNSNEAKALHYKCKSLVTITPRDDGTADYHLPAGTIGILTR